jgi:proline iminopeptidase
MNPDEYTIQELFLDTNDGHQLYVQEWGKTDAKAAIIFLHGGPGNGCDNSDKQKFDPTSHRVIFHDQRGSGKSLPVGSLEHNETKYLVEDIDKIIKHFNLTKFILVGGSWGSTLALCYAVKYPNRPAGLILDGVYTATERQNEWLDRGGWRSFYPEIWEEYQKSVPAKYKDNPSSYHATKVLSKDPEEVKKSAYAYLKMELSLLKLDGELRAVDYAKFDPNSGKIELHYISQKCFLPEKYILNNAENLKMPIKIIQGRYDMVCPPETAYELHKALPDSELSWTINGHLRQHEAKNIQRIYINQLIKEL